MNNSALNLVAGIPIFTKVLIAVNVCIHLFNFIFSIDLGIIAINGYSVVMEGEYYRLISSAFTHGGILHIFFNMSSLVQLGSDVEKQFGSAQFIILSLWSVLLTGILYVGISWSLTLITGNLSFIYTSSVGYSGVLFTYALIDSFHTTETSRSFFGVFNVPAKLYPFILLIALQVIIPNISFFGHLSGILVGLLSVYGCMDLVLLSPDGYLYLDQMSCVSRVTRSSGYYGCTSKSLSITNSSNSQTMNICGTIFQAFKSILIIIWNLFAALMNIIGCPLETCCTSFMNLWGAMLSCLDKYFCCLKVFNSCCSGRNNDSDMEQDVEISRTQASTVHTQQFSPMVVQAQAIVPSSVTSEYKALPMNDDVVIQL